MVCPLSSAQAGRSCRRPVGWSWIGSVAIKERQRKRDDDSGQCPEQSDVKRLQRRPDRGRQFREIRRHGAPYQVGHAIDPGHEVLRPRLNHNERLNDDGEPQQSESEMHRFYERAPPCRRADGVIRSRTYDIELMLGARNYLFLLILL